MSECWKVNRWIFSGFSGSWFQRLHVRKDSKMILISDLYFFVVERYIAVSSQKLCHLWDLCRNLPLSQCSAKNVLPLEFPILYYRESLRYDWLLSSLLFHPFFTDNFHIFLWLDWDLLIRELSWTYRHPVGKRRTYHRMTAEIRLMWRYSEQLSQLSPTFLRKRILGQHVSDLLIDVHIFDVDDLIKLDLIK